MKVFGTGAIGTPRVARVNLERLRSGACWTAYLRPAWDACAREELTRCAR
jgi:hypothetical protein